MAVFSQRPDCIFESVALCKHRHSEREGRAGSNTASGCEMNSTSFLPQPSLSCSLSLCPSLPLVSAFLHLNRRFEVTIARYAFKREFGTINFQPFRLSDSFKPKLGSLLTVGMIRTYFFTHFPQLVFSTA